MTITLKPSEPMPYFTEVEQIKILIGEYASKRILWLDTEVADYQTRKPRISLIQVLDDPEDLTGDRVSVFDVLNQPDLVAYFIDRIMVNPAIEKVFHNAKYDLKFLGKTQAQNVTCTLEIAKKIPYYLLPLPNIQLKTIAASLGNLPPSYNEQASDWGKRPLRTEQLHYAQIDPVYLAQVHRHLLQILPKLNRDPANENLTALTNRYLEIAQEYKLLETEINHLQDRIKQAMQAQNVSENEYLKLTSYQRNTKKVDFDTLAEVARSQEMKLSFPISLTQQLQKQLGNLIQQLPLEEEQTTIWRLTVKKDEDDEIDF